MRKLFVSPNDLAVNRNLAWDGWRGCAILLVLCGHFFDIKWVWEDRMGVDVFFVLSGMLMSGILFEKRLSLRDFYIRRLSRVFPTLLVYVAFIFTFSWLYAIEFSSFEVISSLAFMRTYLPAEPHIWESGVVINHLWSLNVEEHAYVLLSLISLAFIRREWIGGLLLILAALCIALGFYQYSRLSVEDMHLYLIRTESAVVFILVAAGYGLLKRRYDWQLPPWVPVVCFALAFLCYARVAPVWLIFAISPLLLGVAVNHLDRLPHLISQILSTPAIRYMGLWSYSIYLWQQFFYNTSWIYPGGRATACVLAVLVGVVSFYTIENPVRRWINGRWSAQPSYRA
jgi:peptidoglycan/LPS O-acetylase OafA/YrhL